MKAGKKGVALAIMVMALMSLSTVSFAQCIWTVQKAADQSTLTLGIGESFIVNYGVTVGVTPESVCSNYPVDYATATDSIVGVLGEVKFGIDSLPFTFTYPLQIGPFETCGDYTVENTATLCTGASSTWRVSVHVPCGGCTRTIGYWKTHAGLGPQPDVVTPLLPIWLGTPAGAKSVQVTTATQAVGILSMGKGASNGIKKLYAQLLGAKLNIASGADDSAIAGVIAAADAFLATHNAADWSGLNKAQRATVLSWMTELGDYNNGAIGPGHCSD